MKPKIKLKSFLWSGYDRHNIQTNGVIDAINIDLAKAQLIRNGMNITKIKKQPTDIIPQSIKQIEITIFARQLATMSRVGISITRALDTIIESSKNNSFKKLINELKLRLESGETLSDSLRLHPKHFDPLFCNLCSAGEASGTLDIMLERLATHREAIHAIKKKVKRALLYPTLVIAVAMLVMWVLFNYAIPTFAEIFISSGKPLPKITQITLSISQFSQKYWWLPIIFIVFFTTIYKIAKKRSPKVSVWRDLFLLKIPIVGQIIKKSSLIRFSRTLEITTSAGMPLLDALKAVSGSTGNAKYKLASLSILENVTKGQTVLQAATKTRVFPSLMLQMISVGEESGQLEEMLANVASIYEDDVELMVANLSTALEPIILIFLGCMVLFLLISIYIPLFNLGGAI